MRPPVPDLSLLRRHSLFDRPSLESIRNLCPLDPPPPAFRAVEALADRAAGFALDRLALKISSARRASRPVVWASGAHTVKLGLSPVIVDLMKRGFITAVAVNGAFLIHEIELALAGRTSEDVASRLPSGDFGFSVETSLHFARAALRAASSASGLASSVAREILLYGRTSYPSILASALELGLPVTAHVAIGTDIVSMHPEFPAAAVGSASHADFLSLAATVSSLDGGVFVNVGSAVILPEVFLKVLSIACNLGSSLDAMTTAVIDQFRHYRPEKNVLERPPGDSIFVQGRFEELLPMLRWAVLSEA
ncbi:MAG: hypothetical protein JW909_01235 [Planctomycetes bacterium]|nr:hypothetical protein [Planctomycetota bacterium]